MELILTKAELKGILEVTKKAKEKSVLMNGVLSGLGEAVEVSAWDGDKFYNAFISISNTCEGVVAFHALNFTKKLGAVCKAMAKDDLLRIHYEAGAESFSYELGSFTGESPAFDTTQALEKVESLKARNHVVLSVSDSDVAHLDFEATHVAITNGKLGLTDTKRLMILDSIDCNAIDNVCFVARNAGCMSGFKIIGARGNYKLIPNKGKADFERSRAIDFERIIPKESVVGNCVEIMLGEHDAELLLKRIGLINIHGVLYYENGALSYVETAGTQEWQERMSVRLEDSIVVANGKYSGQVVKYIELGLATKDIKHWAKSKGALKLPVDDGDNTICNNRPMMMGDDYVAMPWILNTSNPCVFASTNNIERTA